MFSLNIGGKVACSRVRPRRRVDATFPPDVKGKTLLYCQNYRFHMNLYECIRLMLRFSKSCWVNLQARSIMHDGMGFTVCSVGRGQWMALRLETWRLEKG